MNRTRVLVLALTVIVLVGAAVTLSRFLAGDGAARETSLAAPSSSIDAHASSTQLETVADVASAAREGREPTAAASDTSAAGIAVPAPKPDAAAEPTLVELKAKAQAMGEDLDIRSRPFLKERYERGLSEYIDGLEYKGRKGEEAEIFSISAPMGSPKGMYRTALPRAEFPDLYAIKDEILAMRKRIRELESEAIRLKWEKQKAGG